MTNIEAARAALELAAKKCEEIESEYWDLYKGRSKAIDNAHLYSQHTEGKSDGACECAAAIRAIDAATVVKS